MKKTEKQMILDMKNMLEFLTYECLNENGDNDSCPRLHADLTKVHALLSNMVGFDESEMD